MNDPSTITFQEFYSYTLKSYIRPGYLTPADANILTLEIIDLFSDRPCEPTVLQVLGRFLTIDAYTNLVDERTINGICGYPLCHAAPERKNHQNPLRVLSENAKLLHNHNNHSHDAARMGTLTPFSYLNNYCSKKHYQCSQFYVAQLSDNALFLRDNLFVTANGEFINQENYHQYIGKIILLEDVWREQASRNQVSLVDVLTDLNIGNSNSNNNQQSQEPERIIPDELMKDEIVEKFPQPGEDVMEDDDDDDDNEMISLEQRAKQIDGYVTEF
ncbi:RNA polymerase II subunit B1 CTD phosphatase [Saccharomycopsis crataegensis]|uniref:RNA polymerase II subunit B1 CTD phosphatase RPAP2 homolog n=1 Tax=Saccharomycopsis crataegensis TaxID=43959 RepID=A0AAV5QJI1_9ASCO|nr:RNA polymerase II subunit B1 CTD phosphatase [Saccharomycopsis crataegensis]